MKTLPAVALSLLAATPALADEGMWTFDAFPAARMKAAYGWAPDQAWLDRVQAAAVRLTGGCSASFVSADGLILTNDHCVLECAQNLSSATDDYVAGGFLAADRPRERKCPGQQAEVVLSISDVTGRVKQAIGASAGEALVKARDAAIARIEGESCTGATTRCQVVTLYGGGQYKLYRYRKYSDVRLVWSPEYAAGFFGGDPDNFNFPRFNLDAAFLRAYEDGKPVSTPQHLTWNPRAPQVGEATFVVGNPGRTQRLYTQDQIAMLKEVVLPLTVSLLSEYRGRLIVAREQDAARAREGADDLVNIENAYKVYWGQARALDDEAFAAKLAANESDLRSRVRANPTLRRDIGNPWQQVAAADTAYRDLYREWAFLESRGIAGYGSSLFRQARTLVRAAAEREKPNAERLPEFTDSALPLVEKQLLDDAPVYPWLERLQLEFWLSKAREYLTVDSPESKTLLGRESPEALSARLVSGTRLADPGVRKKLFDGGMAAIAKSDDPMIRYVLAIDPAARAIRKRYDAGVAGPIAAAQARLSQARFAAYGAANYPDATFTLRISYGKVMGWVERGRPVPATTDFSGLYERATGEEPFKLSPAFARARPRLDLATTFDFVATNDIIGGNSGSPVIAKDGSVIGAAFDGNIHSLGGNFGYDPALNRTVVVSAAAVQAALETVYPAPALLRELKGK